MFILIAIFFRALSSFCNTSTVCCKLIDNVYFLRDFKNLTARFLVGSEGGVKNAAIYVKARYISYAKVIQDILFT